MDKPDEMIQWEAQFKKEHPIAMSERIGKVVAVIAITFILAVPMSLIVLGVHWLFTRWW